MAEADRPDRPENDVPAGGDPARTPMPEPAGEPRPPSPPTLALQKPPPARNATTATDAGPVVTPPPEPEPSAPTGATVPSLAAFDPPPAPAAPAEPSPLSAAETAETSSGPAPSEATVPEPAEPVEAVAPASAAVTTSAPGAFGPPPADVPVQPPAAPSPPVEPAGGPEPFVPPPSMPSAPTPPPAQASAPPTTAPTPPAGPGPVPPPARPATRVPAATPVSVTTVAPELAQAQRKLLSGDSAARRTGRSLRKLVGSSAAREVETATRLARDIQQPVDRGRQIVVTSIRGGAGKTTVAALLGRTLEHYRHDPVLTLEADPALGTLPVRMGAQAVRWTCGDLARIVDPSMLLTDVMGYLVQLPDGGWLLPGSQGRVGTRLDPADYGAVIVALRRFFAMTVVDCETLPSELARSALAAAHARVLVAPATLEGVTSTRSVLDWMASLPSPLMLRGTVVVLASHSPHMTIDLEVAAAHLRLDGVHVLPLPYDRHLAAGGVIRTSLLGAATREAVGELAAALVNRAVNAAR